MIALFLDLILPLHKPHGFNCLSNCGELHGDVMVNSRHWDLYDFVQCFAIVKRSPHIARHMATLVQGSYVPSPVGVASSTDCQSALDRTELDDLIDELLRDVDEYRRLQSPRRPRSRGSSCLAAGGERSRSGSACSRSEDLRIDVDNEVDVESTQMLTSGGSSPVGFVNDVYSGNARRKAGF